MKLSSRLQACADFVIPGNTAADIGTDHGYLPIYLYRKGICPRVFAADLREKPLASARANARRYGIEERIEFFLSYGLQNLPVEELQTVICAGMGGDCIAEILRSCPRCFEEGRQFILQPQSATPELRLFLSQNGFEILRETFAQDGRFVYAIMDVRYTGEAKPFLCGEEYLPQGEVPRQDPLYAAFLHRVEEVLVETVENMHQGRNVDPGKLRHFESALELVREECTNGICSGCI